jgi:phosphoribosyl 1,2-cyclic phosphodiesterase
VELTFCGVRGSTPATGDDFVEVGGNTSCVAVTPDGAATPTLVLDAGTGIRAVTEMLAGDCFVGTILLTHLHWDHVQGLPFFAAGDRDDAVVSLVMPDLGVAPIEVVRRCMSPPHFPIGPEGLRGEWSFQAIDEGRHVIEGLRVLVREIPHKGGRTFGYRLEDDAGSVAYLPDHRPASDGPEARAALELVDGVDILIHNAQFADDEVRQAAHYGHSTVGQAIEIARRGRVGRLLLFHHAPGRTDDGVDAILASVDADGIPVDVAREGDRVAS